MPTNLDGFVVFGAIEAKWLSLGGPTGFLGHPRSNETPTFDGVGRFQSFQGGVISWHPETAAHVVQGLICARWREIGAEKYGYPITDETATPDRIGRFNHFRALHLNGKPEASIYWTPQTGAHEVYGGIRAKWASMGWEKSPLGYPVAAEGPTFDGAGRNQPFQGGAMSWHPDIGAHSVQGLICARWREIGAEKFGYPITDETATPDGHGRFSHFRSLNVAGKPEASIYWTQQTGAHEVYGGIRAKWAAMGWEKSPLGYPVGSEGPTFDGVGRNQPFQGGALSWHPELGAHAVQGLICARWRQIGAEKFGYPITDETATPDGVGRFNHFRAMQNGKPEASIYWTPTTGAHEVYGAIRDRWARRGWERSSLGYPLEEERDRADGPGRAQRFQHGRIVWAPATGALFDPLVFSAPITSGGAAALGGSITVTVNLDGSVRWQGHAHDSGADGYDFAMSALVRTPGKRAIALAHQGHVGGTFTSGSRDHDWEETRPPTPYVSNFLADFNDGQIETHLEYSSDIGSSFEKTLGWLVKFGIGSVATPVGLVIFVGVEAGSLISTGSLVPGARIVEGVLWMAGPGNTLLAIAAEGIASAGSRTRQLTREEYDWANAPDIFAGSLPPLDRIVLTDTIGGGNRAFTFPRFDGKITVNMGPDAFADPRKYQLNSRKFGQTFVHELVHACQIQHATVDVALLADAFASKVCEATGSNPYVYPAAGPDYSSFNLEQQAQIMSDWFAGAKPPGTNQTGIEKDVNSPYFRYITGNIRVGHF